MLLRILAAVLLVTVWMTVAGARPEPEIVIPGGCITAIAVGKDTECAGPDKHHLRCSNVLLTYRVGCELVRAPK
jgi:hypothetical protein